MAFVTFYHYTSKDGLDAIRDSGYIQESSHSGRHAHFGEGAYGTSLHPREGHKKIAHNNWGHEYPVRVERAIELQIPKENVKKAQCDRDILVHHGPIDLSDYEWKVWHLARSDDEEDDDDYVDEVDDGVDDDAFHDADGNDDDVDSDPSDYDDGDQNDDYYDYDHQDENYDDGHDVTEDADYQHDDTYGSKHDDVVDDDTDEVDRGHDNIAVWEGVDWGRDDGNDRVNVDDGNGYYEDYDDDSYFHGDYDDNECDDEMHYDDSEDDY